MVLLFNNKRKWIGLGILLLLLVISSSISIALGITLTNWRIAYDAIFQYDPNNVQHIMIHTTRLPRVLIGATVGCSLAIAGVIIQAITRNPLASPGVLGINAGAALCIVIAITFFSISALSQFIWVAFLGATITTVIVYLLGSLGREGLSPLKIILAGAAITALCTSWTQAVLIINERTLNEVIYWLAGSIAGRSLDMLTPVLPYFMVGWIIALLMGKSINLLIMGEELAVGLGQKTFLVKLMIGVVIILLAGGSVAVAGPIVFVGIIIPHLSRFLVGTDYRWLIPYCGLLGASFLIIADVSARFLLSSQEVPVGVMTAIIGVPFFVYIARKGFNIA